jgi:excisionase family DNA binding protein
MPAVATQNDSELIGDGFATVPEASKFLRLSRTTLYEMMDRGELRYAKFGKSRRIPWAAVKALAAESLVGGGA